MNDVFTNYSVGVGMIMMWSRDEASLPLGWKIADGTTYDIVGFGSFVSPDLRGRFVKGAHPEVTAGNPLGGLSPQPLEEPGDLGGNAFPVLDSAVTVDGHVLTEDEMPAHTHGLKSDPGSTSQNGPYSRTETVNSRTNNTDSTGGDMPHTHTANIESISFNNQPEYYIITYIVYVGQLVGG